MRARVKMLLCAIALLTSAPVLAAVGSTWRAAGAQEFASGKLEGVAVVSTGEVELAPQMDAIEGLKADFVWDAAAGDDGTVYVGTGGPGAVYRVRAGRVELLHQTDQEQVVSVLAMPDGTVLAGTAPRGIVYRINRRGEVGVLADLPDAYIWDMALTPTGQIVCATGPDGRLVQLDRLGKATELLKVKQRNLMCVAVDADGNIYAGTEPDGYIYRIPRDGKATVLYDADESEVHSLLVTPDGVIYAGTAQGRSDRRPQQPGPSAAGSSQSGSLPLPPNIQGIPSSSNSVYRIVPGKGAMRALRFDRTFVLALGLVGDRLLVGTGPGGRIIGLEPDGVSRMLATLESPHVTAIAALPDGEAVIGASNSGRLWSMKQELSRSGTLYSKPFDATYLSRWGSLKWQSRVGLGQNVRIKLRTGNSAEPDETWSEWSQWATEAAGQPVEVPLGRFAQFAAELSSPPRVGSPALVQVEVSYRQANREPVIDDITIDGRSLLKSDGRSGSGPPDRPPGPSRNGKGPGERTIAWKAADPNGDELRYDLYYRALDETEWKLIEEGVSETKLTWDTSRVPDGLYQLRLVASDRAERPEEEALRAVRISFPTLIDNRPPSAVDLRAVRGRNGRYELTGTAVDDFSAINQIQVSDNAGDWQAVFPVDGILDSPSEAFSFETGELEPGEHVFVFAVTDSNDNTGSGKIIVEVAGPAR